MFGAFLPILGVTRHVVKHRLWRGQQRSSGNLWLVEVGSVVDLTPGLCVECESFVNKMSLKPPFYLDSG